MDVIFPHMLEVQIFPQDGCANRFSHTMDVTYVWTKSDNNVLIKCCPRSSMQIWPQTFFREHGSDVSVASPDSDLTEYGVGDHSGGRLGEQGKVAEDYPHHESVHLQITGQGGGEDIGPKS